MSGKRAPAASALLLTVALIFLGMLVLRHTAYRREASPPAAMDTLPTAPISLQGVHHTAVTDGAKVWSLSAAAAEYDMDQKKAVLKDVKVVFFGKEGDTELSAKSGTCETGSNNLEVSGDVVIKTGQEMLETQKIAYAHARRMFVGNTKVTVTGISFDARAERMEYFLDQGTMHLYGNVTGTIGKNGTP